MARLFLIAGEPSGDRLGAALMRSLRALAADGVAFDGIGGEAMAAEGLQSRFPMAELSLVGVAEVLPHLPRLLRRIAETAAAVRAQRPAALVTIDAPSFSLRVGRRLAGAGIPRIHYVAPQVWAWRPGRARHLGGAVDHLLALLPFEPPFFTRYGVDCRFVGHPAVERPAGDGPAFRQRHGIDPAARLLCLLPGSRGGEVRRLLPLFGEVAGRLTAGRPDLRLVVPTVRPVAAAVAAAAAAWPGRPVVVEGQGADAFAASDAALAASGTVSLELALAGTPTVVTYRANPITAAIVMPLVTVDHVSIPNLIAERRVMPELVQGAARPETLAAEVAPLLDRTAAAARQQAALTGVAAALGAGAEAPSRRAARAILERIGVPVAALS